MSCALHAELPSFPNHAHLADPGTKGLSSMTRELDVDGVIRQARLSVPLGDLMAEGSANSTMSVLDLHLHIDWLSLHLLTALAAVRESSLSGYEGRGSG